MILEKEVFKIQDCDPAKRPSNLAHYYAPRPGPTQVGLYRSAELFPLGRPWRP
ncbi:unnamed protein product [Calicophoron daubneyi]|uniref:Uncharacterized protein n=1 Tax=Calicophoron daubneyi TaxID=300641 RepID=A0AAV2TXX7_CALDB